MSVHGAGCECNQINENCTVLARSAEECAQVLKVPIVELENVARSIFSIKGITGSRVKCGEYYIFFQKIALNMTHKSL
jgi:hypothetical protein